MAVTFEKILGLDDWMNHVSIKLLQLRKCLQCCSLLFFQQKKYAPVVIQVMSLHHLSNLRVAASGASQEAKRSAPRLRGHALPEA